MDAEVSTGYAERFFVWLLIPFIFTLVLIGVLLSVFGFDVKNQMLIAANKIPFVNQVVPEPKTKQGIVAAIQTTVEPTPEEVNVKLEEEIEKLNKKIEDREAELQMAIDLNLRKDESIEKLESEISELLDQLQSNKDSQERYEQQVKQLASTYGKMMPSKAAPIIENLTIEDRLLVLGSMRIDEQVKILEKLDPKIAAEILSTITDSERR